MIYSNLSKKSFKQRTNAYQFLHQTCPNKNNLKFYIQQKTSQRKTNIEHKKGGGFDVHLLPFSSWGQTTQGFTGAASHTRLGFLLDAVDKVCPTYVIHCITCQICQKCQKICQKKSIQHVFFHLLFTFKMSELRHSGSASSRSATSSDTMRSTT